jgi:hypothetical protein
VVSKMLYVLSQWTRRKIKNESHIHVPVALRASRPTILRLRHGSMANPSGLVSTPPLGRASRGPREMPVHVRSILRFWSRRARSVCLRCSRRRHGASMTSYSKVGCAHPFVKLLCSPSLATGQTLRVPTAIWLIYHGERTLQDILSRRIPRADGC